MDWNFIREYAPMFAEAAGLTARIGLKGILLAIGIGLVGSIALYYKVPVIHRVLRGYIELSRNTPLLIQLFFLYFGLPRVGILISSEGCAIIGLGFLGGSYMMESFRAGLESVSKGQKEIALSLGMKKGQMMRHVILPQGLAVCVPTICANVIFLIKETSVFSAVALADLMFVAKDLIGMYYKTEEALFLLVISYLIILLPISIIFSVLERKVRYAGFGN